LKSLILYFSQYGNTLKIAEAIQQGIISFSGQSDVANLLDVCLGDLAKYDLIGIGSPVWRRSVPPHVLNIINKLESRFLYGSSSNNPLRKQGFVFCTHGAIPGIFLPVMITSLKDKGLTIIGWHDWYGGVHLPYQPVPYYTDGHPDRVDMKEATEFGKQMAERSMKIRKGETGLIPEIPTQTEWENLYGKSQKDVPLDPQEVSPSHVELKINRNKCTRCGLCVHNCPANSLDFSGSVPVFRDNCIKCFVCEQMCPEKAIEGDFGAVVRSGERHAKERIEKQLLIAETKGRFRRLVPWDKIGWNTPDYEKRSG
jgi:ferredoxin